MDPSEELQKLGQQAYKRKNFHAALNFFNSVITSELKPSISVLDNRAATYEKLGDLQAALKDGRRMIQDHKGSCAGYLRTAKILQLQEKYKAAADIYRYGLRNVPPSESNFKLLRQMHDEMSRWYTPHKARDPLAVLPSEIAAMVMAYLDFRQIVSITRVSVQWQRYVKSMPALWTKLDFSAARKMVPRSAVQKYLNWSKCNATEVRINRFVAPQDRLLPHFARICRPLETLRIDSGSPNESLIKAVSIPENLRTLILSRDCEMTADCVSQVLSKCRTLIRAEFHHISYPANSRLLSWPADTLKLQILKLHLEKGVMVLSIDPLLERLPDIRELSLTNWTSTTTVPSPGNIEMRQLQNLELVNYFGVMFPPNLPSLRFLTLKSYRHINMNGWLPSSDRRDSGLVELSTPHAGSMEVDTLVQLLGPDTESLRRLDISHCRVLETSDLAKIVGMGYLDRVVELDLSGTATTDDIIELLAPRVQQLSRVKLAATHITGISVKALVGKPDNKVVHLDIRDCCNVSSDAIAFARTIAGLTVQCGSTSVKYGRKLRF